MKKGEGMATQIQFKGGCWHPSTPPHYTPLFKTICNLCNIAAGFSPRLINSFFSFLQKSGKCQPLLAIPLLDNGEANSKIKENN